MKKFLQKVWASVKSLWQKADEEALEMIPVAIKFVDAVKKFLDSPYDEIAISAASYVLNPAQVALIQKGVDGLNKILPGTMLTLEMLDSIAHITDPTERLNAIVGCFKLSPDEVKNQKYHELCYKLVVYLSDGKLTWQEASAAVQYYYDNIYKPSLKQ